MYDRSNIFAKILRGESKCKKIFENDYALSFYDIYPKSEIHALIIPKGDYTDLTDFLSNASNNEKEELLIALKETLKILNVEKEGYRLISNSGINSGQEVPHLHFHILAGKSLRNKGV